MFIVLLKTTSGLHTLLATVGPRISNILWNKRHAHFFLFYIWMENSNGLHLYSSLNYYNVTLYFEHVMSLQHDYITKDICATVPRENRHKNCFSFYSLQKCLRQHANTKIACILCENYRIFAQSHGTWFKSITILTHRLVTISFNFLTVSKAENKAQKNSS